MLDNVVCDVDEVERGSRQGSRMTLQACMGGYKESRKSTSMRRFDFKVWPPVPCVVVRRQVMCEYPRRILVWPDGGVERSRQEL